MGKVYQVNDLNNFEDFGLMNKIGFEQINFPQLIYLNVGLNILTSVLLILVLIALFRFIWKKTNQLK